MSVISEFIEGVEYDEELWNPNKNNLDEETSVPQKSVQKLLVERLEELKKKYYMYFLSITHEFERISNKKIAQIIFQRYMITKADFYLNMLQFGQDVENMEFLDNFLLNLKPLNHIGMNLGANHLGQSPINIKYLELGFRPLVNLKKLNLDLSLNLLGEKRRRNMQNLDRFLSNLCNIQHIQLDISYNCLDGLDVYFVFEGIQKLQYLNSLDLNCAKNELGKSKSDFVLFKEIESNLNLKHLNLNLSCNKMGNCQENLLNLMKGIKKMSNLESLVLGLGDNIEQENIVSFKDFFKNLSYFEKLTRFDLNLEGNYLEKGIQNQQNNIGDIFNGIENLAYLKSFKLNLRRNDINFDSDLQQQVQKCTQQLEYFELALDKQKQDIDTQFIIKKTQIIKVGNNQNNNRF